MKKILLFATLACALLLPSCKQDDPVVDNPADDVEMIKFVEGSDVAGVYFVKNGYEDVSRVDEQVIYDEDHALYMVSNYDCTKFYQLNISGALASGSKVNVSYTSQGYAGLPAEATAEMYVGKVSADGNTVWLWNSAAATGFILRFEPVE